MGRDGKAFASPSMADAAAPEAVAKPKQIRLQESHLEGHRGNVLAIYFVGCRGGWRIIRGW